jgi:RNA polymerase-binding protein DksA
LEVKPNKEDPLPVKMNKADLKYFEKLIKDKRSKLMDELSFMQETSLSKSTKDASGDLSAYSVHMGDQASDVEEQEHNFHLAEREGAFLEHLEQALERIKNGTYGICKKCQKLIAKPRLEAVPHTTMCISCKEAEQDKRA